MDCLIHPFPRSHEEFGAYCTEPLRSKLKRFGPNFNRGIISAPMDEYLPWTVGKSGVAASEPDLIRSHLDKWDIDLGLLVPLTRGLLPDMRRAADVAAATNSWLAAEWLDDDVARGRLCGSIRVSARDVQTAIAEIEKWASDPRYIQVAVSLESQAPYGQEQYFPIWEAASAHGLPVMVVSDRARGIGYPLTPLGNPRYFIEGCCEMPLAGAMHLVSLIAEGVFDRLPELRFIFADGCFDAITMLLWRATNDWRGNRADTPWVMDPPIDYLESHVRFILHPTDGPDDIDKFGALVAVAEAEGRLLFGSRYPYWDFSSPVEAVSMLPAQLHARLLGENALLAYPRLNGWTAEMREADAG